MIGRPGEKEQTQSMSSLVHCRNPETKWAIAQQGCLVRCTSYSFFFSCLRKGQIFAFCSANKKIRRMLLSSCIQHCRCYTVVVLFKTDVASHFWIFSVARLSAGHVTLMLELGRKKKDKPVWLGFTVQTSVLKQAFQCRIHLVFMSLMGCNIFQIRKSAAQAPSS